MIVTLSVLILGGPPDFPPEATKVMEKLREALKACDVSGPYRLQGLGSDGYSWTIRLSDAEGNEYEASDKGKAVALQFFWRTKREVAKTRNDALGNRELEKRARRWLKRLAPNVMGTPRVVRHDGGLATVSFPVTVNGYPFVGGSNRYTFSLDEFQGGFMGYQAGYPYSDSQAVRSEPRLDQDAARAAFDRAFDSQRPSLQGNPATSYTLEGPPELGYGFPKGGGKAILVWYFRFRISPPTPYPLSIQLDATTGLPTGDYRYAFD